MYNFLMAASEIDNSEYQSRETPCSWPDMETNYIPHCSSTAEGTNASNVQSIRQNENLLRSLYINIVSPMPKLETLSSSTVPMQSTKDIALQQEDRERITPLFLYLISMKGNISNLWFEQKLSFNMQADQIIKVQLYIR